MQAQQQQVHNGPFACRLFRQQDMPQTHELVVLMSVVRGVLIPHEYTRLGYVPHLTYLTQVELRSVLCCVCVWFESVFRALYGHLSELTPEQTVRFEDNYGRRNPFFNLEDFAMDVRRAFSELLGDNERARPCVLQRHWAIAKKIEAVCAEIMHIYTCMEESLDEEVHQEANAEDEPDWAF